MSTPCLSHIPVRRYDMSFNNQYFDTVDGSSNRSSSLSKWENLTIKDRFLFAKVMGQKENCLPLLQRLFPELQITDIRYVEAEKTVEGSIDSKAVRLDVYVRDSDQRAFTLEMQVYDKGNLPMRSRYYGSMMDENLLSTGRITTKSCRLTSSSSVPLTCSGKDFIAILSCTSVKRISPFR